MASGGGLPHPLLPPPVHSPLHPLHSPNHFPGLSSLHKPHLPTSSSSPNYSGEYNIKIIFISPVSRDINYWWWWQYTTETLHTVLQLKSMMFKCSQAFVWYNVTVYTLVFWSLAFHKNQFISVNINKNEIEPVGSTSSQFIQWSRKPYKVESKVEQVRSLFNTSTV